MSGFERRTVLKGLAGAVALGGVGTASGHPSGGSHDIHRHHQTKNAELVGFHGLGSVGEEPAESDWGSDPIHGVLSEVWVEDDLAFVSMLSTSEPTGNRGVAVVDVSEYTRADEREELKGAEMEVLSYIGNETEAGTAADVKVSDDGQYLFYSKQAIGTLYGNLASASTDPQDAPGAEPLGIAAYDISDPENPRYLGTAQGPNAGFHNCFTHRIGGEHYVFGVQGVVPGDAGVHIYRLDETGGGLEPVNFWSGGDLSQGEYETDAVEYYCHDFYAHDDPVTGRPVGYIAYWNNGVQVIDLSEPTDIEALGVGEMSRAHYAQPAPTLIDGKRVFIGGQEWRSRLGGSSGEVVLFDGDGLFDGGFTTCERLDTWELYQHLIYSGFAFSPHNADITTDGWITQAHYHAGVRFLEIQPPGDGDVATDEWHIAGKRVDRYDDLGRGRSEVEDSPDTYRGQASVDAYGNAHNLQYHEFSPEGDGLTVAELTWDPQETAELDLYLQWDVSDDGEDTEWETAGSVQSPSGPKSLEVMLDPEAHYRWGVETDYGQAEYELAVSYYELEPKSAEEEPDVEEEAQAYYRDHVEVSEESRTLNRPISPNFWGARIENGVTFASGINSGLYAIAADPIDVGTRRPVDIEVERTGDGSVRTPGETVSLEYEVDTDKAVHLRDRLPPDWEVTGGDRVETKDVGDGTRVQFQGAVPPAQGRGPTTRTVEAEVGGEPGTQRIGPVRYSTDGGETWEPIGGTVSTEVVGPSLLGLGL